MHPPQNERETVFLEKLPTLVMQLHAIGYQVGHVELAQAKRIFQLLKTHQQLPTQVAQFGLWLKPLLCHSPAEQARFAEHFSAWLIASGLTDVTRPKTIRPTRKLKRWRWMVAGLGFILAISFFVSNYWLNQRDILPNAERKLSVTVEHMPVRKMLLALAYDMNVAIDIHPSVTGQVTLVVSEQTFTQLLDHIATQAHLHYQFQENQLMILPGESSFSFQQQIGYITGFLILIAALLIGFFPLRKPTLLDTTDISLLKPLETPSSHSISQAVLPIIQKAILATICTHPYAIPQPPINRPPLVWDTINQANPLFYTLSKTETVTEVNPSASDRKELIVVFYIVAHHGRPFSGVDIFTILEEMRFEYGEMAIFHCYHLGDIRFDQPVLSVANLLEPGTFDKTQMKTFSTPGLALFMRLPNAFDGRVAFELLLNTSYRLAAVLEGHIKSEQRRPLDVETVDLLRQKVAEY